MIDHQKTCRCANIAIKLTEIARIQRINFNVKTGQSKNVKPHEG